MSCEVTPVRAKDILGETVERKGEHKKEVEKGEGRSKEKRQTLEEVMGMTPRASEAP